MLEDVVIFVAGLAFGAFAMGTACSFWSARNFSFEHRRATRSGRGIVLGMVREPVKALQTVRIGSDGYFVPCYPDDPRGCGRTLSEFRDMGEIEVVW